MASQWKILLLFVILVCAECKRFSGGGGRFSGGSRTGSGTHHYGGGGSNTHAGGSNTHYGGSNTHSGGSNTGGGSKPIGFEHYNVQGQTYNTGNTQGGGNRPIGFEGVHDRVPPQNNRPNYNQPGYPNYNQPGSHPNYNQPGSHPNYNQHGYQGGQHYAPPGYQQHAHGGYYTTNPQPPSGYQNNYFAQPNSYYHPQYQMPHQTPVIYQPMQQSSGSNFLGYAGSFAGGLAGGYLIGSLAHSASSSHNDPYVVHHYYHNNEVPKKTTVYGGNLVQCNEDEVKGLCVPNSFPVCMYNGTVMCVTHLKYVVPCVGLNTSAACVLTVLPCGNNCNTTGTNSSINNSTVGNATADSNSNATPENATLGANSTAANSTSTGSGGNGTIATYIPCLTNTTIVMTDNKDAFCVTAIAEPKVPRIPSGRVVANEPSSGSFKSFSPIWMFFVIVYCLHL